MTEDEFNARHSQFVYRGEIIGRMRDCLLPSVLKTGEEYLFVATEPYGGDGDFALRGGILLGVDTDRKTCTMRGDFSRWRMFLSGIFLPDTIRKLQESIMALRRLSRCSVNILLWRSSI